MRVIKLSKVEFESPANFYNYITSEVEERSPKGKFRIPKGYIAKDQFSNDETVIFVQDSIVIGFGQASSNVLENDDEFSSKGYPNCFIFNTSTFRETNFPLAKIEDALHKAGLQKNITRTQGWPRIPQEYECIVLEKLIGH